jgi:serine/threonine protein phosphatase 1
LNSESETVIAVGDIHGRFDLLDCLMQAVFEQEAGRADGMQLVFLGDYIDRGPRSREVLDYLISIGAEGGRQTHCLLGNHEQLMLTFLDEPAMGPAWFDLGGRETLLSYGVRAPSWKLDDEVLDGTSKALAEAMPEAHVAFLKGLKLSWSWGDYLFVHAGLRPGRALADQSPQDMLWIRGEFLDDKGRFDRIVVHGHTPDEAVHCDHRRIGIDTGAYATEVLTALRIEGPRRSLIQTRRDGAELTIERSELEPAA